MIHLALAIFSSALIALLMRLSEKYRKSNMAMLAMNYLMCSVLGLVFAGPQELFPRQEGLGLTALLGVIGGGLYLGSFVLMQWNITKNGVVLPATFMKLGVLVPTVLSILVFGEVPTLFQVLGMAAAVCAIWLMQEKDKKEGGSVGALVLLLLADGCAGGMSKVYEEVGNPALQDHFLLYIFAVAMALCLALCLLKKQKPCLADAAFGLAIGVPNYFSSRFLLLSLGQVPATVAYPGFSVGTILLVAAVSAVLFQERLNKRKKIALGVILLALVLLNI